jgi:hypothetical protein
MKGEKAIDRWQNRARMFRKKAKGWSVNLEARIKKENRELIEEYNRLDITSETRNLSDFEKDRMQSMSKQLNDIWDMEETRATDRIIKEGDRNTKYFQTVANQRRRKTTIHNIDGTMKLQTLLLILLGWQLIIIKGCLDIKRDLV